MIRRVIIMIGIPAIILIGWHFTLEKKAINRQQNLRSQITETEKRLFVRQAQLAGLEILIDKYSRLHDLVVTQETPYSGVDEIIDYYKRIYNTCSGPEYHLEEITPSLDQLITFLRQWQNRDSHPDIPFDIKVSGEYVDLAKLMETIENDYSFHRLQGLKIKAQEQSYPDCYMELSFAAYLDQLQTGGSND